MASRLFASRATTFARALPSPRLPIRSFQTTRSQLQEVTATPVKKPVGAFRGGLFGFLLGVTVAGASAYYYVIDEYRLSNDMLTEDIYSLQAAVQRLHDHITELENKAAQGLGRK
ncbi:hypothetical protein LTR70_004635 [Exophiala xenobiotica]|uniref:Uncharacterized protein n=1 Tax=Lithohypha guttulata TaxID=1690604 RepID=A0ABR0KCN8_9EURO|nr:hypothetical protein LTR24_004244 [Lithohypha guttulata]KAK5320272.1 hypothetical protein LTR70_004635 [Exophiala xenobiotica]